MLLEAGSIGAAPLGADVCIIGAGPAGLTIAAELAGVGLDVLVLEAGGMPYDRHSRRNFPKVVKDHLRGAQALARGRGTGEPYYPLRLSRARGLAGSTNALMEHGLRGRPLDSIDFGARLGATWPISHQEMAAHLPTAEVYAGMRERTDDPVDWQPHELVMDGGRSESIVAAPFRHGSRDRFARLANDLAGRRGPRLVIGAVVTRFDVDRSGSLRAVEAVAIGGSSFRVRAQAYVLAAGGIDNARLLLNSRPALYAMDESADHVGRNFMEHLHYAAGYLIPSSPDAARQIRASFGDPLRPAHWLTLADDVIRDEDLLRSAFAALPVHEESLHPAVPAAGELMRTVPFGPYGLVPRLRQATTALRGASHVLRASAARFRDEDRNVFALALMSEQQPHPDSRVTLAPRGDRTGLLLPSLHWRVARRDFDDACRALQLLATETERMGWGRVVSICDRGVSRPEVVTGGWHHMGTTMMSASPTAGVVDENCRVYGIANLFVAGSSVFATSGYANPTLTLVALAVRLARYLADHGETV